MIKLTKKNIPEMARDLAIITARMDTESHQEMQKLLWAFVVKWKFSLKEIHEAGIRPIEQETEQEGDTQ